MPSFTPKEDCIAYRGKTRCEYLTEMVCANKGRCSFYNPTYPTGMEERKQRKRRAKRYTDPAAFELWQQGKNDSEIAAAFGVSRQTIQKWRDIMELPSTTAHYVDTQSYRLIETKYGYYVMKD